MAQQPALLTGKLREEAPDVFTGDRTQSKTFKQQFCVYRHLNPNHKIMAITYYHVMQHLALIKGPLVNGWKDNQIQNLLDKTT
jgi:hypothetical protein